MQNSVKMSAGYLEVSGMLYEIFAG